MKKAGWIILAVLVVVVIYAPGLSGGFLLDDSSNLTQNEEVQLQFEDENFLQRALGSSPSHRPFARPLAMLSFAIEHAIFDGFDPLRMKIINLAIHLTNMLLLSILLASLIRFLRDSSALVVPANFSPYPVALFLSFAWAVLPGNLDSVLYVVQRMNLLAGLFVLVGLALYFQLRADHADWRKRLVGLLTVLPIFLLGFLCKENAILGWFFLLVLELVVGLKSLSDSGHQRASLAVLSLVVVGGGTILMLSDILLADAYARRPFDMWLRLGLQPQAMIDYQLANFVPLLTTPRFYMDYFVVLGTSGLDAQAVLAIIFLLLILVLAIYQVVWRHSLLVFFSLGWFFIFHLSESSVLPLEVAFQHRNYLPSVGILLGLAMLTHYLWLNHKSWARFLVLPLCGYLAALPAATAIEALRWGDPYTLVSTEAERSPKSPRATYQLGLWYEQNDPVDLYCREARDAFDTTRALDPTSIAGFYGLLISQNRCGFTLTDEEWAQTQSFLSEAAPSVNNLRYLDLLYNHCATSGLVECSRLEPLVEAALDNPQYRPTEMATLHFINAKLAFYQEHYEAAIARANRALEANPENRNASLMMLDIMNRTSSCEALDQALQLMSGSELLNRMEQRYGNLNERFANCFER